MYKKTLLISLLGFSLISNAADFPSAVSPVTEAIRTEAAPVMANPEEKKLMTVQNAEELADKFIENMVVAGKLSAGEGWNDTENVYLSKGVAVFDTKGAKNSDLMMIRALKYTEAVLNAKQNIIQFVRTELSTDNLITLPETGLSSEFDKQLENLKEELDRKTKDYQASLKEAGVLKDDEMGGVNTGDLFRETIIAVINKLGGSLDVSSLKKEQQIRIENAKRELLALQSQIDALKKEIESKRDALGQTSTSKTETLASMVLTGALVGVQFESLVDGQYQVVVVVTWSPKQERFLRAMLKGEDLEVSARGNQTIGQYIRGNDWSSAIGGRKFVDSNGDLHLLGIGAASLRGKSSQERQAAEISAGSQARSQIALSLYGDTKAHEKAQQKIQEVKSANGGTETINTESFSRELGESVQGLQLQGISKRLSKVVVHPLTGQQILVYIADYSIKNSRAAKDMELTTHKGAMEIIQTNKESAGFKAGLDWDKEKKEADLSAFNSGFSKGQSGQNLNTGTNMGQPNAVQPTAAQPNPQPGSGSMQGAGASESNFLF